MFDKSGDDAGRGRKLDLLEAPLRQLQLVPGRLVVGLVPGRLVPAGELHVDAVPASFVHVEGVKWLGLVEGLLRVGGGVAALSSCCSVEVHDDLLEFD